ncbi:hypothetical protein SPRG_13135 [Saprolegnia parasitica CBS 223.65]|uniref:Uncharacterized protein n=1 Tax=Saprolegnia parasitica (strain CBS 223.65) TaxID=695850 RepID=A0A067BTA7_SAPPC|nr:hypothetical protein SPRG_13135 [Saprolegnia parasitica CBS 223.65]KDO21719.1 hypothetical protein SPRG_13135 [Saprolegnia parasitica CBS 223.65]|eukprot:XP_012207522.1 hypothetical protein SPRG_13135 [Saprolegnia parasitica CBS 223.65]
MQYAGPEDHVAHLKHVLETKKAHELGQIQARASLRVRGASVVYAQAVEAATRRYEAQVHALKTQLLEDLTAELKMLRENRDGVTLLRKGLSRAARTHRMVPDDDRSTPEVPSSKVPVDTLSSVLVTNRSHRHKALGSHRYASFKTAPAPAFLADDLAEIAVAVVTKRQRLSTYPDSQESTG